MWVGWFLGERGYPEPGTFKTAIRFHRGGSTWSCLAWSQPTEEPILFNAALVSVADTSRRILDSGCGEAAMR